MSNVVKIFTTLDTGTKIPGVGFIAGESDNNLFIATANHVVRCTEKTDCANVKTQVVEVKFFDNQGEWIKGTLLDTRLDSKDLAVVRVPKPNGFKWTRNCLAMESGELSATQVWYVGKDDTDNPWYVPEQPGAINNGPNTESRIEIDISGVSPGTSGAPLITSTGIIGMIVQDGDATALALYFGPIKQAFAQWHYPWSLGPSNLRSMKLGDERSQLKVSLNDFQVFEDGSGASTRWDFQVTIRPFSEGSVATGSQIVIPQRRLSNGQTVAIGQSRTVQIQRSQLLEIKIVGDKIGEDGTKALGSTVLNWEEADALTGSIDVPVQVPNKPKKGNFVFHFAIKLAVPPR